MNQILCALLAAAAARGFPAAATNLTDELRAYHYREGDALELRLQFDLPNSPLAYGFAGDLTAPDYFTLELVGGRYRVSGCRFGAAGSIECAESPKWALRSATIRDDRLLVAVSRDLAQFPVRDLGPAANLMAYDYTRPDSPAEDGEEDEEDDDRASGTALVPTGPVPLKAEF